MKVRRRFFLPKNPTTSWLPTPSNILSPSAPIVPRDVKERVHAWKDRRRELEAVRRGAVQVVPEVQRRDPGAPTDDRGRRSLSPTGRTSCTTVPAEPPEERFEGVAAQEVGDDPAR
jgi:hypothetical protein